MSIPLNRNRPEKEIACRRFGTWTGWVAAFSISAARERDSRGRRRCRSRAGPTGGPIPRRRVIPCRPVSGRCRGRWCRCRGRAVCRPAWRGRGRNSEVWAFVTAPRRRGTRRARRSPPGCLAPRLLANEGTRAAGRLPISRRRRRHISHIMTRAHIMMITGRSPAGRPAPGRSRP